jgi:hypothetical protein
MSNAKFTSQKNTRIMLTLHAPFIENNCQNAMTFKRLNILLHHFGNYYCAEIYWVFWKKTNISKKVAWFSFQILNKSYKQQTPIVFKCPNPIHSPNLCTFQSNIHLMYVYKLVLVSCMHECVHIFEVMLKGLIKGVCYWMYFY